MNYELCKKLRDAGFPFKAHHLGALHLDGYTPAVGPNLSELIEECLKLEGENKRFFLFNGIFYRTEPNKWVAGLWDYYDRADCIDTDIEGSTPEEAVASLYIKLNSDKIKEWDNKKENNTGIGKEIK